ncbi:hypothetical protein KXQ82_00805 [Mucilaginibacter sp. HMF5004]|uniref:hypothetical protein n=1 Tax=Mucilaginibacter rivuli TaxID=2857527 RepID=UPI001C5CE875|nr:hypothetical protein [Mucilaginibacter rivuli]MBW4888227.1 hypothetical protein [Mucilaginibacter rivuli]
MKKYLLIALLFACFCPAYLFAQKLSPASVPLSVRSELMRRYPDAGKATWEKRGANYQANWGNKTNKENSAIFTPSSAFVRLSNPTDPKFLPVAVISYVQMHYHSPIIKAGKSIDVTGKQFYDIQVKGGQCLLFTSEGRFVKIE